MFNPGANVQSWCECSILVAREDLCLFPILLLSFTPLLSFFFFFFAQPTRTLTHKCKSNFCLSLSLSLPSFAANIKTILSTYPDSLPGKLGRWYSDREIWTKAGSCSSSSSSSSSFQHFFSEQTDS